MSALSYDEVRISQIAVEAFQSQIDQFKEKDLLITVHTKLR
mgnify:CR=1 FL=1